MKIVIADGLHEADYIISLFKQKHHDLIVINEDEDSCHYLSLSNDIPVMRGRCTRESELKMAGAENCDLFIALSDDDFKNYVACKTAKMRLNAKKCIATVINPKNVSIFKQLGIDSVVCSTYLLGQQVNNITTVENLIDSLSLEDEKIVIVELKITSDLQVCGKSLKDLDIANLGTISSVIHEGSAIIPNGQTVLNEEDKILVVTTSDNKDKIVKMIRRKK